MKILRRLCGVVFGVALVTTVAVGAHAADRIKLLLDFSWWPPQTPFIVAQEKGFYSQAGLAVEFEQGKGSGPNAQLLSQGVYDVSFLDLAVAAQAISKGGNIITVANINGKSANSVLFKQGVIKNPQDVKGKKIGAAPGGSNTLMFPAFLAANNINEADVNIISLNDAGATVPALLTDRVDAILAQGFYQKPLQAPKGFNLDYINYADTGAFAVGAGFAANVDFLKKNPDAIKRLVAATGKGVEFTQANPDEAVKIYLKVSQLPQDTEVVKRILVGWLDLLETPNTKGKPFGWSSDKDWTSTLEILEKYLNIGKPLPHDKYYTNAYVSG